MPKMSKSSQVSKMPSTNACRLESRLESRGEPHLQSQHSVRDVPRLEDPKQGPDKSPYYRGLSEERMGRRGLAEERMSCRDLAEEMMGRRGLALGTLVCKIEGEEREREREMCTAHMRESEREDNENLCAARCIKVIRVVRVIT